MAAPVVTTASGRPVGDLGSRILELYRAKAEPAADAAMLVLDREVKETLSQSGSGRIYRRGQKTHQASAPGEPPAVDTGDLRRKTGWQRVGFGIRRYGAATKVGAWMERGTRWIKARPWLAPSLARSRGAMREAVRKVMSG